MAQKLYFGSPDRTAVEGKKIYCGVDNTSKLVEKIYVGQSGRSVQIYPSVTDRWYAPGWYRFNWKNLMTSTNLAFDIAPSYQDTAVIFPFGVEESNSTGFVTKTLTPNSRGIINVLENNRAGGYGAPLFTSDFNYELAAPDANYFYVTTPFRIQGEDSSTDSMIFNARGFYNSPVQQSIPFGTYSLKMSNLLYAYSDVDNEFLEQLKYFHGMHDKVWFTYYSERYPGYVGQFISLNITNMTEIKLDDYLRLINDNEYLQSAYDSGATFAFFPQGSLTLGLYSVEEGSWNLVDIPFTQLMPKGNSEQDAAGYIWVPFNQPLATEYYSNYFLNGKYGATANMLKDATDKSKLAYWVSDPLCHVLVPQESTSTFSSQATFSVSTFKYTSAWKTQNKNYWKNLYNKFGFSIASMNYQSLYNMSLTGPTAETMNISDIESNIVASSTYPKGGRVIFDNSNACVFIWGTTFNNNVTPLYCFNTDLYSDIIQDMPDNTFSYYNFENIATSSGVNKLNVPLNMSYNAKIRCMPIFYDGQMTYFPGWVGSPKTPTINYYSTT